MNGVEDTHNYFYFILPFVKITIRNKVFVFFHIDLTKEKSLNYILEDFVNLLSPFVNSQVFL